MSTILPQPIVSKSDDRKYRLIKLNNNDLEVILISDPTTDKSSAAVNVNAGQLQDPIERQGLAHFLEHMLFLGTKKYPDASQFDQHLNQNSGYSNAYTSLDQTNYYFHCSNSAFAEALDRFAQFFIEPLFTQDLTSREMNAVNSENQKNLQQDLWREYQLFRTTSKPGNPYNKFGTGNLETLNFPSTRDDLIQFYQKYYSSNLMKAVILSNESLDALQAQAEQLFASVPNRNLAKPVYAESPFDDSNLSKLLKIVPCKQEKKLKFVWILPDYSKVYKKNPGSLLSHLFGHEGENSLLSSLVSVGLGESVSSSSSTTMGQFTSLNISITLTEEGFQRYQEVISMVFAFAKVLKEKANTEWLFNEHKGIQKLKFDFKDKEQPIDYTYYVASSMQERSYEDILIQTAGQEQYDKDLIQTALDYLTPENLRISLVSPTLENDCKEEEYYYKVKYSIEPLSQEILDLYKNPTVPAEAKKIDLPPPNTFIPRNFDLCAVSDSKEVVAKLLDDEKIEVYYKKDDTFKVPKVSLHLQFKSNDCGVGDSALAQVQAILWTNLFKEYTRELCYLAEQALLDSDITFNNEITLKVDGFSDSIKPFVLLYLEKLVSFDPATLKREFGIFLSKLQRELSNFFKQPPYVQGAQFNEYLLLTRTFSPKQLQEESQNVTFETFSAFHQGFLKNVRLELFVGGNITSEEVLQIANICTESIFTQRKAKSISKGEIIDRRAIASSTQEVGIYQEKLGAVETNSYICANYEVGENRSIKSRVMQEVLHNFLDEAFFTQLRTTECLGYICWVRGNQIRGVGFIRFVVQSDVQSPQYIASRIEAFIQTQLARSKEFTSEQFETLRNSVEVTIKEKDVSIKRQAERFFSYITQHHYQFDLKEKMLEELKNITLSDLVSLFETTFVSKKRLVQTHLVSPKHEEQNTLISKVTQPYNHFQPIASPAAHKLKCSLHPDYFSYSI